MDTTPPSPDRLPSDRPPSAGSSSASSPTGGVERGARVATRPVRPATAPVKPSRGLFSRLADRIARPTNELEDEELQADAVRVGATPICDLSNRERAHVCGLVRSVTLRPRTDVPALVVEIYDGSRPLHLVWLGRREITGITPGVQLRAQGRVSYYRGIPTMFNPFYEIVPKSV